jgi:hypothetical protein
VTVKTVATARRGHRILDGRRPEAARAIVSANAVLSAQIPTLDGWRAIAILLVLVCHSGHNLLIGDVPSSSWLAARSDHCFDRLLCGT